MIIYEACATTESNCNGDYYSVCSLGLYKNLEDAKSFTKESSISHYLGYEDSTFAEGCCSLNMDEHKFLIEAATEDGIYYHNKLLDCYFVREREVN